jgi:hypothetical protein
MTLSEWRRAAIVAGLTPVFGILRSRSARVSLSTSFAVDSDAQLIIQLRCLGASGYCTCRRRRRRGAHRYAEHPCDSKQVAATPTRANSVFMPIAH